jgi:hypothetical protein
MRFEGEGKMNQVILTARHRKCLQNGCYGGPQGENEAQLYTGTKIRQECLDQGWLERLPDSPAGFRMYRTTDLGRVMLTSPTPKKASTGPKIKMLPPRIKTLDTRTAKPLPRKK